MRLQEAQWIHGVLTQHLPDAMMSTAPVVLNLGSGSRQAREVQKPHINALTLAPLAQRGYRLVHADLFAFDGVDLQGDLFDTAFVEKLTALQPALIYFCNVLEHVNADARHRLPSILAGMLRPGGLLVVTVPFSYPYHPDPIDTYFRPSPQQVAELFPGFVAVESAAVDAGNYGDEFFGYSWGKRVRRLVRLLFPFIGPRRWYTFAHKFMWLNKPYRVSCVLLQKH